MAKTETYEMTALELSDFGYGPDGGFSLESYLRVDEEEMRDLIKKLQITDDDLENEENDPYHEDGEYYDPLGLTEEERENFDPKRFREEISMDYGLASTIMRFFDKKIITYEVYFNLIDFLVPGLDSKNSCGWFQNKNQFENFTVYNYVDMLLIDQCNDYCANSVTFVVMH
ncbi:MAG: hypothetical protein ACTSWX_11400 [Promethearchaeota archaeon]